jgi:hypothetical protein
LAGRAENNDDDDENKNASTNFELSYAYALKYISLFILVTTSTTNVLYSAHIFCINFARDMINFLKTDTLVNNNQNFSSYHTEYISLLRLNYKDKCVDCV